MKYQKAEIKACTCHWLGKLVDEPLEQHGFKRKRTALVYLRKIENGIQKIDIAISHKPSECPNASAVIYPDYSIAMYKVNEIFQQMIEGQLELGGNLSTTLWGPIEWNSPKEISARWYIYQSDSVPEIVLAIVEYLLEWTIPFLDRYKTIEDISEAPTEGDHKVAITLEQILNVIAAKIICGNFKGAQSLLNHWFGKPGLRRRYGTVFGYLEGRNKLEK